MAEANNTIVIIPIILEVAEVEFIVTVRVAFDVRHPVVAISVYAPNYPNHQKQHLLFFVFYAKSKLLSLTHRLI